MTEMSVKEREEKMKSKEMAEKNSKMVRDKYKSKGLRGVLVNLDLDLADEFYNLAKMEGSKPTKVARDLITRWVVEQNQKDAVVEFTPEQK